jgi:hypothetical protein
VQPAGRHHRRVVDEHGADSKFRAQFRHCLCHLVFVADVGRQRQRRATLLLDLSRDLQAGVAVNIEHAHPRAFLGETQRYAAPDPWAAP